MSDGSPEGGAVHQASQSVRNAAKSVREVLDEGHVPGQSADKIRAMVREAPLLALASAFLMGILFGRRR